MERLSLNIVTAIWNDLAELLKARKIFVLGPSSALYSVQFQNTDLAEKARDKA